MITHVYNLIMHTCYTATVTTTVKLRMNIVGALGGVVVKALRYKPAGRGFDSRWCHWNSSVT